MKIFTAFLAGLLVLCVGTVMSQTCPSYTAGFTGQTAYDSSSNGAIYVNDAPAHHAPCDGTVYAWHYCYYLENRNNDLQVAFGVYEHNSVNDQFILRPGSYYLLQLGLREDSFTCETVTLSPSQYFEIYDGDRVGACMRDGDSEFLDVLAHSAPENFTVAMWGEGSGNCGENEMRISPGGPDRESATVLHLSVDINIDECVLGEKKCNPTLASCTDIVGVSDSFECTCNTGYTGDGVTCTNIDECSADAGLCHQQAKCVDTDGSYTCTCNIGYTGDGQSCNDIDECTHQQASCISTNGSHTCSCNSGYTGNGTQCSDIDECSAVQGLCDANAACINNDGSYACICNDGYSGNGTTCSDIDECEAGPGPCDANANCTNTDGSYECICNSGYTGSGLTCSLLTMFTTDCGMEIGICDTNADCINDDGTFVCICNDGYTGNGFSCSNDEGGSGVLIAVLTSVAVIAFVAVIAISLVSIVMIFFLKRKSTVNKDEPQNLTIDNMGYDSNEAGTHGITLNRLQHNGGGSPLRDVPSSGTAAEYDAASQAATLEYGYACVGPSLDQFGAGKGDHMYYYIDEHPYCVPANEENELYRQIQSYGIKNIPRSEIQITSHLGSGQFGSVNKCMWRSGAAVKEVAVKTLTDSANIVKFLQEAAIMAQFRHPNVVTLYGVVSRGKPKMMVIELIHQGDLKNYLKHLSSKVDQMESTVLHQQLLEFCGHVCLGMQYLAQKGFVHRDLAARNVLVSINNICKIADFGMSRDLADDDYYVSHGGKIPVKWTAPEALRYKKHSTASDVWSYGCVLYEIWSLGHTPFGNRENIEVVRLVNSGYRLPPPSGCPRMIYELMMHCWHPNAADRLGFGDVLQILLQNEEVILAVPETIDTQAVTLGADLEAAHHLYSNLQYMYTTGSSSS